MSSVSQFGLPHALTETSTKLEFDLGRKVSANDGSVWVYIEAGTALEEGDVISCDLTEGEGTAEKITASNAADSDVVGVAQNDIASGSYGFVQISGEMSVKVIDAEAGETLVVSSTAGVLQGGAAVGSPAADAVRILGITAEAAAGSPAGEVVTAKVPGYLTVVPIGSV